MANAPYITKVYLLDVPLENDYKNTLFFTNEQAQHSYFSEHVVKSYTDFSYQRKDNIIRVPDQYDTIYNVNYVMYQNSNYNNKWFYAFITDLRYINDGLTEISIETDVMQTWLFNYQVKQCFVEREHTNNDTVGNNIVPENLELGEYINQECTQADITSLKIANGNSYIVIGVTETGLNDPVPSPTEYNGVYSGLTYLTFPSAQDVFFYLQVARSNLSEDNVHSIFLVPQTLFTISSWWTYQQTGKPTFQYRPVPVSSSAVTMQSPMISKPTTIDNYSPRNNKLYTYPFRYLMVSNNAGSTAIYRYEDWKYNDCSFIMEGAISVGCSIKLTPVGYKLGTSSTLNFKNYVEGLDAPKFPTCAWTNDVYTNWLTQNSINYPLEMIKDVGMIAGGTVMTVASSGIGSYAGVGLIANGAMGIADTLKAKYEASLVPNTAKGGISEGDLTFSLKLGYTPYKMCIKRQNAEIIDKYFDLFGYQTNKVKVPNSNHRQRWWYTKTIDAIITGSIPNNDIEKIKSIYNNGVTFWKNASEIGNYSLSNNII